MDKNNFDSKNILLCGVGGQGIILASKILASGLIEAGYDVKMSEVHGMAQRGGSVTTQVRYGKKIYSPIIGKGQADVLVSFESMEAARWIEHLKSEGTAVINEYEIPSAPILAGAAQYPKNICKMLESKVNAVVYNATKIAEDLGNIKATNVVLLGSLVKAMGLEEIVDWNKQVEINVKPKFAELNKKAFLLGLNACS